jgi:hypothetical protein
MVDRTDIDALLISALYGELTPADEARLTAHLESHPADRTALADLTQTRAAVRDSRILAFHDEPPQSVSTMLLREAARRAPRAVSEDAGWFHRFMRSFMAHPAMAAAAMLVLVVGVAGTLYVRHGDLYAPPTMSESAPVLARAQPTAAAPQDESRPGAMAPTASTTPAGAVAPEAQAPASEGGDVARNDQHAAGSGSYGVGLAEGEKADAKPKLAAIARGDANTDGFARDSDGKELRTGKDGLGAAPAAPEPMPAKPAPAYASKPSKKGSGGIEVLRSREPVPKDFDDEQQDLAKRSADRSGSPTIAKNERAGRLESGNAGPAGGGATPAPVTVPVLRSQDQPADVAAADPSPPASGAKLKSPAPAKTVARSSVAQSKQPPQVQAAPPPPPPASAPASETLSPPDSRRPTDKLADKAAPDPKAEEKSAEDPVLAWAAQQHRQVVALVNSDKCLEAAKAAVAIYNRAPGYYASSVATDRSIKPCLVYVTTERERVDRRRAAAKRATATDTPAASPPPPARK